MLQNPMCNDSHILHTQESDIRFGVIYFAFLSGHLQICGNRLTHQLSDINPQNHPLLSSMLNPLFVTRFTNLYLEKQAIQIGRRFGVNVI